MRAGLLVCRDKCGPRKEGDSGVAGSPGLQEVVCTASKGIDADSFAASAFCEQKHDASLFYNGCTAVLNQYQCPVDKIVFGDLLTFPLARISGKSGELFRRSSKQF